MSLSARMLRRWLARSTPGPFDVRPHLALLKLEDRLAPTVSKPAYPDPTLTAPFTSTEILARVVSPNPLQDVANVVAHLNLSPAVDAARTSVVFGSGGMTLVSLALRPGADPLGVAHTLSTVPSVFRWVSPNYVYSVAPAQLERIPNDPRYGGQWHLPQINAPVAWDTTYGNPGVTVAILDDGIDLSHPDLKLNIAVNLNDLPGDGIDNDNNGYVDDLIGWDFADGDYNPNPGNPLTDVHGTQVAGLVAGRVDNANGVAGVAGRVKFLPVRVVGNGTLTSLNLAKAAAYSVSRGAKIITNSTNIDTLVNDPVFSAAVDFAYDRGVLWINSAGNADMADPPRVAFEQMVLVAATDRFDQKTDYSNYGRGIDISAPGGTQADGLLTTVPVAAGSYGFAYGTSMAAPLVAGAAALIWSANPGYSRDQVASRLLATADDLNPVNPGYEDLLGSGRLNAGAAVGAAAVTSRLGPVSGLPGPGQISPFAVTAFSLHLPNPLATTSVAHSSFDLRGAGADNLFDTADDAIIPFSINDGRPYYFGTNDLSFTAYGLQAEGLYRFTAKADRLRDPFGRAVDGDGDGLPGGDLVHLFGTGRQVSGTVFEDSDGDGTDGPTDPGLGGSPVFVDDDRDGRLNESTFASTPGERLIPDSSAIGVSSTILVSGADDPITRTTVRVQLRHAFPSDLTITLTTPTGRVVTLLNHRYLAVSPADVIDLTFDDSAGSFSEPDATGRIRPEDPLSVLFGEDADGPWTLTVIDSVPQDEGSLVGWSLSIATEPVAVSNPDGSFSLPRIGMSDERVILTVPQPGWTPVQPESPTPVVRGVEIGLVRPGTVYGRVILDDGGRSTGFPGAVVYADRDGNGKPDDGEETSVSDSQGRYVLTGLSAGTYTIRVTVPRAFTVFSPADGRVVTVSATAPSFGNDFRLVTDAEADRPVALPVTPDPRNRAVGSVSFDLARPNDHLSLADLTLTRDGIPVPLDGTTLIGSGTTYTLIGLDPVTAAEGRYTVTLTPSSGQGEQSGQSASAVGTWTTDTTAPIASIRPDSPDTVLLSEPVTGLTLSNFRLTRNGVAVPLTGVTLSTTGSTVVLNNLAVATAPPGEYSLTLAPAPGLADAAGNPLTLPATVTFTVRPASIDHFVVGADAGGTPLLNAYDPLNGALVWRVYAFEPTFSGGVRVATGDVNGDGITDAIVAPGPGRAPEVRTYNGKDGTLLFRFSAFESSFTGGVFVAAADLNGDGKAEVVVTPDRGGGPRVRVLADAGQTVLADFFGIDDPNFRGGSRAALGDLNHDGTPDLLVAAGFGGGPRVAGYNGAALLAGFPVKLFNDFFAFEPALRNGAYIALGDLTGDGYADLITAGGPGGAPRVQILGGRELIETGQRVVTANFFAGSTLGRGGVRVAVKDLDGDGHPDLLTAAGAGQGTTVRGYLAGTLASQPDPIADRLFDAFPTFTGGVFVG